MSSRSAVEVQGWSAGRRRGRTAAAAGAREEAIHGGAVVDVPEREGRCVRERERDRGKEKDGTGVGLVRASPAERATASMAGDGCRSAGHRRIPP